MDVRVFRLYKFFSTSERQRGRTKITYEIQLRKKFRGVQRLISFLRNNTKVIGIKEIQVIKQL